MVAEAVRNFKRSMPRSEDRKKQRIPAIKFKQWLGLWDGYSFEAKALRRKPEPYLYMFSMKAAELRKLSDVYRRQREGAQAEGIQRVRDLGRTARIQRYVHFGYPYGDLKPEQQTDEFANLRKPGWLPTAIVVNLLQPGDHRHGRSISKDRVIEIQDGSEGRCELVLPATVSSEDEELPPIEVIDGQHRLWAFDELGNDIPIPDDFELPVVAYRGLDVAWQAYLFWSINVSPKRINPSHAFDLYPLLRTQDWLEQAGELKVYREARAQELTECMYSHEASPWRGRINMLGEKGKRGVSQAAWVRGLTSTFLSTGRGSGRLGLFQAELPGYEEPLEWSRGQQAAFLILIWKDLRDEITRGANKYLWIRKFNADPAVAFTDRASMLNQDMGVRAVLSVANDVFYPNARRWELTEWFVPTKDDDPSMANKEASAALRSLEKAKFRAKVRELAVGLARFDWRSLEGLDATDEESEVIRKRSYRGSGGYTALQGDVLREVSEGSDSVSRAADRLRPGE